MTLKLGECQRMSPTGARQFIAAISPTVLPPCSFPQGNSQKQSAVVHHTVFVALSAFTDFHLWPCNNYWLPISYECTSIASNRHLAECRIYWNKSSVPLCNCKQYYPFFFLFTVTNTVQQFPQAFTLRQYRSVSYICLCLLDWARINPITFLLWDNYANWCTSSLIFFFP